ncbi:acyltransferase family protein [Olleya aquimaris]|uniref:Peptidoglycan/LPS O-acetylase OafA/YrhL n=1 Tax=Olleya aquimaris TaxID=639310 RepID=A0A327R7S6_9FLAO|nr:acyltransferase [Olleya aquimaris]RAJ12940.1 peptidoglycan/LPS O-acetylase OafA/YrhL [Olleya aquimaris]
MIPITTYKQRIFGLDVVRAIAILLILCSHSTILLFPESQSTVIKMVQFFGTIGVDIFFVLSGFLIGTILIKHILKQQTSVKQFTQFWMRRWFRTLPNYYLVLLINIGLLIAFNTETPKQLFKYFFFLQNFSQQQPDFFTESWSLSIEEFAYLLGPILLMILALLFKRLTKWSFLLMTLLVIIGFTLNRFIFDLSVTEQTLEFSWSKNLRKVVVYRIDSIYYGFLGAFSSVYYTKFWRRYKWLSFMLGAIIFVITHLYIYINHLEPNIYSAFFNIWYLALVSISILLTFPVLSNWRSNHVLTNPITKISLWSYSIYLVNYSIVLLTIQKFINISILNSLEKVLVLLLFWSVTFCLSFVLFTYFEYPIIKFRDSTRFKRWFRF